MTTREMVDLWLHQVHLDAVFDAGDLDALVAEIDVYLDERLGELEAWAKGISSEGSAAGWDYEDAMDDVLDQIARMRVEGRK